MFISLSPPFRSHLAMPVLPAGQVAEQLAVCPVILVTLSQVYYQENN